MNNTHTLRRIVVSLVLLVAFLCQGTWALAGTTGGLSGQVTDEKGAPVAGAAVKVTSASQIAAVTTDAGGHFSFLTLAPDTYTVSTTKDGYTPASNPGVSIFADQTLTLAVQMQHAGLKNIANVTSRGQSSLVKPGTTVDVYAVNQQTATQLQTFGGGNNLDSAYSAIYAQPGVQGLPANFGFGQVFYIHGSSYYQIGYEYDGVPVNRAFDNYNANSLSNLGTISTEVYTGGGPASGSASTLGGYINQVIKTGTFPGYANIGGAIGGPGYYHQAQAEAGGSTPDRNFSWYVGVRGSDSIPNQIDDQNGADLAQDGNNAFGTQGIGLNPLLFPLQEFAVTPFRGPWSDCTNGSMAPKNGSYVSPLLSAIFYGGATLPTCQAYGPIYGALTTALGGNELSARDNVINLHFGIPHHGDSGKDDVQVLFDNFFYNSTSWDNISTNGGLPFNEAVLSQAAGPSGRGYYNDVLNGLEGSSGINYLGAAQMPQYPGLCGYFNFFAAVGASLPCPSSGYSPAPYADAYQVTNASFEQAALGATHIVSPYLFPSSPTDRAFGSGFSPYQISGVNNNGSIVKLQYTKNFGSTAYLRIFGYTFYSDWLQNDPNHGFAPFLTGGAEQPDYEVGSHTAGAQLQFSDQLNSHNLLTVTGNYTTATTERINNGQYSFTPNGTPIATLQSGTTCFSAYANSVSGKLWDGSYSPNLPVGSPVSCLSPLAGATINQVVGQQLPPIAGHAATSGATWQLTQNLEPDVNKNTVGPRFATASIQDELRPGDRWDINLGARFESYGYALGQVGSPEQAFWFDQINQTVCVDPIGLVQVPGTIFTGGASRYSGVPSGYPDFYTTLPGQACQANPLNGDKLYHPGQGGVPLISLGATGTITHTTWSPRVGFTYTASPNTVIRFSYGRYTQPTPTAFEQALTYEDGYQMATNLYDSGYYSNGLASIFHDNPIQFSNNWDASFEQHLNGTDWSYKVSPYYRYTSNQSVSIALPGGLAGAFNSGTQMTQGIEVAVQKGDPSRDGFSGQLSYTYTDARIKYALINGSNAISTELANLKNFYGLTKNGGGAPCYLPGGIPEKSCSNPDAITNPYYSLLPGDKSFAELASAYPINGWYPTYYSYPPYGLQEPLSGNGTNIAPNIFGAFVSYKHRKLQVALTGQLWQGTSYGNPTTIVGLDPRSCFGNQGKDGIIPGSQLADYQTCGGQVAIPNPVTGQFDNFGQYTNPWQINLGAQIAYQATPRITVTAALSNVLNACFGGSAEPWTAAFPPNRVTCGYYPNSTYLAWSQGEVYNTAGAGFFYGNSPHEAVNGTTGYPRLFDQAYEPGGVQISAPFQAVVQVNIRL